MAASDFYSFQVKMADDKMQGLSEYKEHVVLVVNVASRCGYTSQYEGLQKLQDTFKEKKFTILGFPSNQFMGQEPGTNAEIQKFCKLTYGVTFPVFAKIDVKGTNIDPLYKWLTSYKGFTGDITWNFNKFLIDRSGNVVNRYGSSTKPSEIEKDIQNLIK
ncbi:MAG: glutathione peroxidase [Pseudobdellovibrio sp.]